MNVYGTLLQRATVASRMLRREFEDALRREVPLPEDPAVLEKLWICLVAVTGALEYASRTEPARPSGMSIGATLDYYVSPAPARKRLLIAFEHLLERIEPLVTAARAQTSTE